MTPLHSSSTPADLILPGHHSPRFVRFFTWYVRRLFAKKFHAVRLAHGSRPVLTEIGRDPRPLIVLLNHSSWWDPLVPLVLAHHCAPSRSACAPMELTQLRTFGFFRRLGLFGVAPDDARSYPLMVQYVLERFASDALPTLWITPQGRFADIREPVVLRPGAAAVAARASGCNVISVAIEYAFWLDQKPEVLIRVCAVPAPANATTAHWHLAMQQAMQANAAQLATLVIARDPTAFDSLEGHGSRVHPVYDWWLKLRGKDSALHDRTREPATATSMHASPATKGAAV